MHIKKKEQEQDVTSWSERFPYLWQPPPVREVPNKDLHQLARKYSDIMYLRLGLLHTVVVSSPRAAELFLKTCDLVFASRPPHEGAKHILFGQRNLSFAKYGSYWRDIRKMSTLELPSNHKINSFKSMRREEVALLIQSVQEDANNRRFAIDLSDKVSSLGIDMSCRMVFGKKYKDEEFDERGFTAVIKEAIKLAAGPNLGDYFPCIASLDLQGFTKKMKAINKVFADFFEKIIDEHLQSKDEERTKDFVDVMVAFMGSEESDYQIERPNIKAIMLDLFSAAMDTSSTTVEGAFSEFIRHPQVMKKVQKELENVVGLNRMVEESDLEELEYLDTVVKELEYHNRNNGATGCSLKVSFPTVSKYSNSSKSDSSTILLRPTTFSSSFWTFFITCGCPMSSKNAHSTIVEDVSIAAENKSCQ